MNRAEILRRMATLKSRHEQLFARVLEAEPGEWKARQSVELGRLSYEINKLEAALRPPPLEE